MKEIKLKTYDAERNHYKGEIGGVDVLFDPFVSGILNGENHDRKKIDSLLGKTIKVDCFQTTSGHWLLTAEGEEQFNELL